MSDWLQIETDDGSFKGYLCLPESGSGAAIVLLQEIFGINAYMRSMAELFAAEGYVAVVPDLFWRLQPGVSLDYSERDSAVFFMERFDTDRGVEDTVATVAALARHPAVTGPIGLVGYCLGGKLAVMASAQPPVACAVSYYGTQIPSIIGQIDGSASPVIMHFGERDGHSPPEVIEAVRSAVGARRDRAVYVYPGAEHGFNSSARAAFNHGASLLAHDRTMRFLRRNLGPGEPSPAA